MFKALVIGCGNIGAMYDFDTDRVLTHAKAYHLHPGFSFDVFDIDAVQAHRVSERYGCIERNSINESILSEYDCISICSPTSTHYEILSLAFQCGVNAIICEKPVSSDLKEIEKLRNQYSLSGSKVLVNYFRRFQPCYIELKETIKGLLQKEEITNINIRYQRGFMNNCSHAFDIIEFLIGKPLILSNITLFHSKNDHFKDDPTISFGAEWNNSQIAVIGLSDVNFSHFEIDIYFKFYKIKISEAGNRIDIMEAEKGERFLRPLNVVDRLTRENCLTDYMIPVTDRLYQLITRKSEEDNFNCSLDLNERLLTYINQ